MTVQKTNSFAFDKARESTLKAARVRRARLLWLVLLAVFGLLFGTGLSPVFAAAPFAPTNLRVDDVSAPVGTEATPYFGWLDNDTNANEIQTGYEILIATNAADLAANFGDVWDSGQVPSGSENHVVYAGAPLTADMQYYWQVRTWNREGNAGPYSTNSTFEVGLLANSDWSAASWIWRNSNASDDFTYYRKSTNLPAGTVTRATVYVTSVQKYALYVNGTLVGKGPIYAFPQFQFYNAYDITGLITPGVSNVFAMFNHWFGGGSGRVADQRGVLMEAIIHYADGSSVVVGTDGTWLQSQATSWVTGQASRGGSGSGYIEKIDARNLTPTWNTNGFDDSAWANAAVFGPQPNSTFSGVPLPNLTRIVETVITPVSVANVGGNNYMVDLGKLYSGVPCIQFSNGTSGTTITMMGGFATNSGGTIDTSQNQTVNMTYYAVLNGTNFTYQAAEYETMRYFLISSSPMPVTTANFSFIERNSQMNDASSSFTSPNTTLNAVWGLMKQTLPIDAQEEFIDSIRQKGGFLGDGYQESLAAMEVENERALTRSRLNEFIESMVEFWNKGADVGRVNACYPDVNNARDIPDYTQMYLAWVWEYYLQTGDLAFLNTNYTQLTNIAQYVNRSLNTSDGLISQLYGGTSSSYTNGIIDWPPDMQFGYDLNTVRGGAGCSSTVIDGWAWEDYDIMSRIANEVGNPADSATYRAMANALQAAMNTNLINAAGIYVDGLESNGTQSTHASQHANAFPLSLNIVPAAQQASVASLVVSSNMSVSALGIIQLVRALGEANQGPALLNLYTNANHYGWAQILSFGGTATWESWTANTDGNSESHGWGAVGLDGYVRYILGIKPQAAQFDQVQIKPLDFGNSLATASGTVPTDRGAIGVEWDRSATQYHLAVTIPVNVTASIYVPQAGGTNTTVTVDGANITGTATNGYLGVSGIGSGAHDIEYAIVTSPPVVGFAGGPTNGAAPLTVTFTNLSSNATNYVWNFGDGNAFSTSSSINVTDTYTNAGSYTVTLTATGPGGTNSLTNTAYIVVTPPLPPVVGFIGGPTNGAAPLTVTFTNLSSNATNFVWNFGDGNTLTTGSNTNVTDTYTNAGNYTVILTAIGLGGTNSLTNTTYIVVTPPLPPVVGFVGGPTNGTAPLTVTFTNLSSNATNYVWNFGDGKMLGASSKTNVTNTYTNAGSYTVILTASGLGGTNSLTNTAYIVVTAPPPIYIHDGTTAITYLASATVSQSVTVTTGATVLVALVEDHNVFNAEPATLTWNGATLTRAVQQDLNVTPYRGSAIYYCFNPPTGTATLSVTVSGADATWLTAYTLAGTSTTAPRTGSVGANATGDTITFNVSGVTAGSWAAVNSTWASTSGGNPTITGTGGTESHSFSSQSRPGTVATAGYVSGLSGGTDTFSGTWTGTARGANFAAAVFSPLQASPTDAWTAAVSTNWDFATANWTNSLAANTFTNGDAVLFDDTASRFKVNLATNVSPASVTFNNSADSYTIGSVGGFSIAGGGALTLAGPGIVTLNNFNTYSNSTTISNGTLLINGSIGNGPVSVSGGTLGGSGSIGGAVVVQAGGVLAPGAGANTAGTVLTINSNLTLAAGSASITAVSHNNHTNDQIACVAIAYGGALTVTTNAGDGPLALGDSFQLFKANSSGNYSGSFSATNLPALRPGLVWSNSLAINGSIKVVSVPVPAAGFVGGPTNGAAPLTVTFTNLSSYATNYVWNFGDGIMLNTSSNTNVTDIYMNAGNYTVILTAIGLGGTNSLTNTAYIVVTSPPPGQVNITNADNGGNLTAGTSWIGGVAPGATNVAVFDSTITGVNPAYATNALGANTAWGEIQILNPALPIQISTGNTLTLNGLNSLGIDMSQAANALTLNCPVALGAGQTWSVANGQKLNVNGVVSGAFPLTINDGSAANGGSIIFGTQASTYSGGTVINGGVVQLGASASLGTGVITNNGGTMSVPAGTTINNSLNFNGTSVINLNGGGGGNNSWPGAWAGSGIIIISNMDVAGTTLTIGGASSTATMANFTGKIIIAPLNNGGLVSQGSLRFNSGNTAANTGNVSASFNLGTNVNDAVYLTSHNGGTINLGELIGGPSTVLLGSRSTTGTTIWSVGGLNTSTTFAGSISNYGAANISALTKVGTGTLILTGTNTDAGNATNGPTGPIMVGTGTLQIGDGSADGTLTSGGVTISNGATLAFDRSDNYTITNNISNAGTLTILGSGTNIYTGNDTGSGSTIVSNGALLVNGSISNGPVSVTGGTLGGSGSIGGTVAVQAGGILSPGAGVSTAGTVLTINSNLTLGSGSYCNMAVSHNNHGNDQVVSSGVSYGGGKLTVITNAGDGALVAGDTFQLFSSGTYSGSGFTTINLPVLSQGLVWSNRLTINGSIEVVLAPPPAPVAGFTGTPTNGVAPMTVTFTNLSSNATNYVWNFGDGNMLITGSNTNVTDTYTNAGNYTVILTAYGPGGLSAQTNTTYIVVTNPPPVAGFSGTPTNGVAPMTVAFTNSSSNGTNYFWDFGDGNTFSAGSNTTVTNTYTNAGIYTVILTAYGAGGAGALTNTAYIVVTNPPPVAGFGGAPPNLFVTQTVTFTDASTGSITNWVWNFGDGNAVTNTSLASVMHAYSAAGTYTVSLTVTGPGGSGNSTLTNYVVVKPMTMLGGVAMTADGKLVFSGTNGPAGEQYRILTTQDVSLPLANWTPVWTNVFAADGSYNYTNTPGTDPATFFLLVSP